MADLFRGRKSDQRLLGRGIRVEVKPPLQVPDVGLADAVSEGHKLAVDAQGAPR